MIDLLFYIFYVLLILGLLYFFFITTKRQHLPSLAFGTLLVLGLFMMLQGAGMTYECGVDESRACQQTGYEYWWANYEQQYGYDLNCCECHDWDINTTTIFCRERPIPIPGYSPADYNAQTSKYDYVKSGNIIDIPSPNGMLTVFAWFSFYLSLVLMAYLFYRMSLDTIAFISNYRKIR